MNKKGFTLIEVIVSVVLVSIVMVSLTATLVEIKKKSTTVSTNTDAVVYSSIISRVINSDIARHNGIKFIECEPNGGKCGLVLGDNKKRTLEILDVTNYNTCNVKMGEVGGVPTGKYYLSKNNNPTSDCNGIVNVEIEQKSSTDTVQFNGCQISGNCIGMRYNSDTRTCTCYKERISSSLVYKDISNDSNSTLLLSDNTNNVYVKTLTYTRIMEDQNVTTEGYGFSRLYNKQSTFKNKEQIGGNNTNSVLTSLTIGIYDGIDKNDATYHVTLYSGSTIKTGVDASVGEKFTITLDTQGNLKYPNLIGQPRICANEGDARRTCDPIERFVEVFNIGYNSTHKSATASENTASIMNTISKLHYKPCITKVNPESGTSYYECDASSRIKFKGYYTDTWNSAVATEALNIIDNSLATPNVVNACKGAKVVDENGNIVAPTNYFSSAATIYACWQTN